MAEFKEGVARAIEYAGELGVKQVNCLAGKVNSDSSTQAQSTQAHETFISNLQYAASNLKTAGFNLLIEPINSFDIPGFFLTRTDQALKIISEVGASNLLVQYDIYHAQRSEGELAATLQKHLANIGHVQLADNPGRNEPGTGEINFKFLFKHLDAIGYKGWVGCEYKPASTTTAGLGWMNS